MNSHHDRQHPQSCFELCVRHGGGLPVRAGHRPGLGCLRAGARRGSEIQSGHQGRPAGTRTRS
jgi:hypothetical protein